MIVPATTAGSLGATVAAETAARTVWQALVIGGGPAGASAAWRLASRGLRTLIVDRDSFPREKVCGCCLSPRAVRELEALAADACPERAVPLDSVRLCHRGRAVRIPLPRGRVVSRGALDMHLVRHAVAAGCGWLPGVQVTAIEEHADGSGPPLAVLVREHGRSQGTVREIRADLVVIATGLSGKVRIAGAASRGHADGSRIGIGGLLPSTSCDLPAGQLTMAVARGGYCGLVRLEDGRIDLAAAVDRALLAREKHIAHVLIRLLDEAGGAAGCPLLRAEEVREASFRATPALTRRSPLVAGRSNRIFRIGDAAGYVEPFTGEGIGWALASARVLADAVVDRSGPVSPAEAASRYVAAHRGQFGRLHARCQSVADALRRPTIVTAAFGAARAMPWAARMLAPAVIGASPRGKNR